MGTQRIQTSHYVSRCTCRAITGNHWHSIRGTMCWTQGGHKDIMIQKQTNHGHVIKGIVQWNQTY